jgi:multidrug transporter EmrE-like cation transporter
VDLHQRPSERPYGRGAPRRCQADLPQATAYAVWVGIGALGAAILGVVLFKEPVNAGRVVFLVLLLVSIVGLKLTATNSGGVV